MIIFRRKQEPLLLVRITEQPYDSAKIDLIPHNIEGPTTSYVTLDGESFHYFESGVEQTNPEIVAHLQALVAEWKAGFYKDLSIRAA